MTETITLPKELLQNLIKNLDEIKSILETIEELLDKEALKRIKEGIKDYKEKRYTTAKTKEELKEILFK
ncbi:MAG: hypothetical protein NDF54_08425 [archaeon GB-1867-035]|nr:hypothetical protein [Candidatus Culexmicrobium profundum]